MKKILILILVFALVTVATSHAQLTKQANNNGAWWLPLLPATVGAPASGTTINAVGESLCGIGVFAWSSGPGTSKVVSAAGPSKIAWWAGGAPTFTLATTTIRIGINDLTGGVEDGTHDVYADLVGGTDTITASSVMVTNMETGTKTIAHGDKLAICVEMTAWIATDTVSIGRANSNLFFPYVTIDTGSGPTKTSGSPMFTVTSNDGSIGWIYGSAPPNTTTTTTYASDTAGADEYALIFQVPFPITVCGITAMLDNLAAGDSAEFILYSDPLGTPATAASRTTTLDPEMIRLGTDDAAIHGLFTAAYDLTPNTNYAAAVRPTTTNTLSVMRLLLGTGNATHRTMTFFGTASSEGTRLDNAGAFTADTEKLPMIGIIPCGFDATAGGGRRRVIGGD